MSGSHRHGRLPRPYVSPAEKAVRQAEVDAYYQKLSRADNPGTEAAAQAHSLSAGDNSETPRTGAGLTQKD